MIWNNKNGVNKVMKYLRYLLIFAVSCIASCSPPGSGGSSAPAVAEAALMEPVDYRILGYKEGLFTLAQKPFTGLSEERYKNGTRKSRYGFKDGRHHGLVEEWYENGNKKTLTHYQDGKHEGENRYWNSDGTPQVLKIWKNDVLISETPGAELKE